MSPFSADFLYFGADGPFTRFGYLCSEPFKTSDMIKLLTHLGAAILFYAVLRNNPKIEKIVDKVFTYVENTLKGLISKITGNDK